jgi:L-lactate dehydrogenase complex protein LldG
MSAREAILARIRANLGKTEDTLASDLEAALANIRSHKQMPRPKADWFDPVARFAERALARSSTIDRIDQLAELPRAVSKYVEEKRLVRSAVCWDEFVGLCWKRYDLIVEGRPAEDADLIGITGAFCAIAETGTLMLLSGPHSPATTSLLPETHIAVASVSRIVKGMEEAWDLHRSEQGKLPRAVNFVSGPSRTADIEMKIVIGAHGPYRVHVILLG